MYESRLTVQKTTLGPKPNLEAGENSYDSPGIFTGAKKSGLTGSGTSSLSLDTPYSTPVSDRMGPLSSYIDPHSKQVVELSPKESPLMSQATKAGSGALLDEARGNASLKIGQNQDIGTMAGESAPSWTAKDEAFRKGSTAAMGIAGSVVGNMAQRKAESATNEYNKMLENWMAQGKYWFDPNSNVTPDFDEYIDGMPSSTDAAADSHMFSRIDLDTKGGKAASNLINPAGAAARGLGMDSEKVNYVWGKSSSRAVEEMGKTGSPYGLI